MLLAWLLAAPSRQPPAGRVAVSVVTGDEELLVERAVARLVGRRGGDERGRGAGGFGGRARPGELASVTVPSLFDAVPVVVVRDAQDAGKEVAEELAALAADPPAGPGGRDHPRGRREGQGAAGQA